MVRLQISSSNFKIYLKNDVVGPCHKGQVSGLWMNQGGAIWTALEPDRLETGACMDRGKAQSCLAVFLLVEQHQLFVFLLKLPVHMQEKILDSQIPKECSPSALGAG